MNSRELCFSPAGGVSEHSIKFLTRWFRDCSGFAELRVLAPGPVARIIAQRFYPIADVAALVEDAFRFSAEGGEALFSVCPRSRERGRAEDVHQVPGLWADVDFLRFARPGEAAKMVDTCTPAPDGLTFTGGGWHLYWKLHQPVPPDAEVKGKLKALCKRLNADPGATDLARMLRVPGSYSWKRNRQVVLWTGP